MKKRSEFMKYVNPPVKLPDNMIHQTFYSSILKHDIGYNIYLPHQYRESEERFPVLYHLHGWRGDESSDIEAMEKAYAGKNSIIVFMNVISSENAYFDALLQIESILLNELIPHIDGTYRTNATRENRMLSGFSMGGAMAFYYAVKNSELFGSVTSYAGTFHHQYDEEYCGVGEAIEKATELFEKMIREERFLEEKNILRLVRQNTDRIRGHLKIYILIGTDDILFCDNEIMHLYLKSLDIPHEYVKILDADHTLNKLI